MLQMACFTVRLIDQDFTATSGNKLLALTSSGPSSGPVQQWTVRPESDHSAYGQITLEDGLSPSRTVRRC